MESSKKNIIIPDISSRPNNHHITIKSAKSIPPSTIILNQNSNKVSYTSRSIINKNFISKQSKYQYKLQQKASQTDLVSFLKRQVSNIIEKEKKILKNKIAIQKDLQHFRNNPQPIIITPEQKIQSFIQTQRHNLYQKQNHFSQDRQKKDARIKQIIQQKKYKNNQKFHKKQQQAQQVRKRHQLKELETLVLMDELLLQNNRCKSVRSNCYQLKNSLIKNCNDNKIKNYYKSKYVTNAQNSRVSQTDSYRFKNDSKRQSQFTQQQNKKITNYIVRMKKVENNILNKEIQNQKRKNKVINSSSKCLVKQRKAIQQKKMEQDQLKYKNKINSFCENYSKLKESNISLSQNKLFLKQKTQNDVLLKREQLKQIHNQYLISQFEKKNSRILQRTKLINNSRDILVSRMLNSRNKYNEKIQKQKSNHQKIMKLIYQKLEKIKKLKGQQDLSQPQKKQIINLLDSKDPQQKQLIDFFHDSKFNYALKKIQEQQQKIKQMKINKKMQRNKENNI